MDWYNPTTGIDGNSDDHVLVVEGNGLLRSSKHQNIDRLSLIPSRLIGPRDTPSPGVPHWDGRLKHRTLVDALLPHLNPAAVDNASAFYGGSVGRYNELLSRPRMLQASDHVPALADLLPLLELRGQLTSERIEDILGMQAPAAFAHAMSLLPEADVDSMAHQPSAAESSPALAAWMKQVRLRPEFGFGGRLGEFPKGMVSRAETTARIVDFVMGCDVDRVRQVRQSENPTKSWWLVHSLALKDTRLGYLALRNVDAALTAFENHVPANVAARFRTDEERLDAFADELSRMADGRYGMSPIARHDGLARIATLAKQQGRSERAEVRVLAESQLEAHQQGGTDGLTFPPAPVFDDLTVKRAGDRDVSVQLVPVESLQRFGELATEYQNCLASYMWGLQSGELHLYEVRAGSSASWDDQR